MKNEKKRSRVHITLYDKPAQVLENIPVRYRNAIVSALISKALDDEFFFEELKSFLTVDEIQSLKQIYMEQGIITNKLSFSTKRKNVKHIQSKIIKESVDNSVKYQSNNNLEKDIDSLFIGFDD